MGNCLVTKLKGVVNNPSLEKLGELHLKVKKASTTFDEDQSRIYLQFIAGETYTIRTNGNHLASTYEGLSNPVDHIDLVGSGFYQQVFFDDDNYDMFIGNKYAQKSIWFGGNRSPYVFFDLSDIKYCSDFTKLVMTNCEGSLTGSLENVKDMHVLDEFDATGADIYGNINNFYSSINKILLFNTPNVTGSVESFVASQISKGRATCTNGLVFWDILSVATFGGIIQPHQVTARDLYWESASKIWIIGGGYVHAKGCTAEEIAAWEQAGKTVVVIN